MGFVNGPGTVVSDGLVVAIDPASRLSYPGSGTTITNQVNSSLNGTLTNGPTFTSSGAASYITTDGTNDYIGFGDNAAFRFTGTTSFSLDLWVYPLAVGNFTRVINKESLVSTLRDGYTTWFHTASGTYYIGFERFSAGAQNGASTVIPNPIGAWHHCVFTYDGTRNRIYYDGVFVGQSGTTVISITNTTEPLAVSGAVSYASYSNNRLGAFKVYNIALTAAQVTQNYNALRGRYGL